MQHMRAPQTNTRTNFSFKKINILSDIYQVSLLRICFHVYNTLNIKEHNISICSDLSMYLIGSSCRYWQIDITTNLTST